MNEEQLGNLCLEWFLNNGWEIVNGTEYSPDTDNLERTDYHEAVLKKHYIYQLKS